MSLLSKFKLIPGVVSFLVLCSSFALAGEASPLVKVAKVGNVSITQEDVARRVQEIMPMQVGFHGSAGTGRVAKVQKQALEELVLRAYKVQYAINEEVSIDAGSFEDEWQKRLEKNKQIARNLSPEQLSRARFYYYFDFLAKRAEEVAVDEKVRVSRDELEKFYKDNKDNYFQSKLYTASHVFVKIDPADPVEIKQEKEERAKQLYERARAGEDFYNLAYYESDDRTRYVGGSLGSFHAGQTVAEFDAAIKSMKPGDIAGPIRTLYGFHIIKMDEVVEARQLDFSEAEESIRAQIEKFRRNELKSKWMSGLKEKYPVEYFTKQVE